MVGQLVGWLVGLMVGWIKRIKDLLLLKMDFHYDYWVAGGGQTYAQNC